MFRTMLRRRRGRDDRSQMAAWSFDAGVGIGALIVAIALTGLALLPDVVRVDAITLVLLPLTAAAAFWRGLIPGLTATLLGVTVGFMADAPGGFSDATSAWLFVLLGVAASVSGEWAMRRRLQRETAARILEERDAHLRSIFERPDSTSDRQPRAQRARRHAGSTTPCLVSVDRR
jgi:hypothetical protein